MGIRKSDLTAHLPRIFVGVVKSLATDGGKVITSCIPVQCKWRFCLFTSPSYFTYSKYTLKQSFLLSVPNVEIS